MYHQIESKSSLKNYVYVSLIVAFYIISTIMMVIINKLVLNKSSLPIAFLWGQIFVAVVLLQVFVAFGAFNQPTINLFIFKKLLPLVLINVIGLGLNTLCLQFSDAIIYQIARSLVIPITICLSPVMLKEKIPARLLVCCVVILVGFGIGIMGEKGSRISIKGITFGILSSFSTAVHSVIIKKTFSAIDEKSPYDMVYYNNFFSALLLFPFLLIEAPDIIIIMKTDGNTIKALIFGILIAGVMGLIVNFAAFLQIKVTSPLTHTVSSAARGVVQSLACFFILGENLNAFRLCGIGITLLGTGAYSIAKIHGSTSRKICDSPVGISK